MPHLRTRIGALAAIVTAGVLLLAGCQATADAEPTESQAVVAPAGTDSFALTAGDGPVVIDQWTDMSCPHCQSLEAEIGDDLTQWVADGEVTLNLHVVNYVSEKRGDTTDWSTRAANALAAVVDAGQSDVLPAFYALLQQNQVTEAGAPTDDDILAMAAEAGVTADISEAVTEQRFAAWVTASNDYWVGRTIEGTDETITGVPTLVVAGSVFEILGDGTDAARLSDAVAAAQ
ncbi:DsbA family protein [Microbacterium fluvii]|uniref:DsbA family protein n=1 Tax=Microbacterium fluvii TaxID=415215 RepID=A0ABW2HA81_9MICO|nr:DsbA family protein [Microbacterium fluvii]MCU4671860.1 DsbA family protein [Microbacterium fluvii]